MTQNAYQTQNLEIICSTPGVRVAEITLSPHADTPPHAQSQTEEVCYCLDGKLTIESARRRRQVLLPGQRQTFAVGSDHRLINESNRPCRFLLIRRAIAFADSRLNMHAPSIASA